MTEHLNGYVGDNGTAVELEEATPGLWACLVRFERFFFDYS